MLLSVSVSESTNCLALSLIELRSTAQSGELPAIVADYLRAIPCDQSRIEFRPEAACPRCGAAVVVPQPAADAAAWETVPGDCRTVRAIASTDRVADQPASAP